MTLPITELYRQIAQLPHAGVKVLQAPPGSGKSTALPLFLLQQGYAADGLIVMLQPRRVAALSIAHYLAEQLGERVGERIGYQIRGQRKTGTQTRLVVVTEGVLLQWLQRDPELPGISTILFDEFHERNLFSDLSLALLLDVLPLRTDLSVWVMSATIDVDALVDFLSPHSEQITALTAAGRQYPIDYHYVPLQAQEDWLQATLRAILLATGLAQQGILVFVPGQREMRWLQQRLADASQWPVQLLHGGLTVAQQQQVVQGSDAATAAQRIILSTNIAETSITVQHIDTVVDSGRERVAVYDPNLRTSKLMTQRVSQASAQQRAGRAGRLQAGHCVRLGSEAEYQRLSAFQAAEIDYSDLAPLILQAKLWGTEVAAMAWLTPPNAGLLAHAEDWLTAFGLLEQGALTDAGRWVASAAAEPRIALVAYHGLQLSVAERAQLARYLATIEEPPRSQQLELKHLSELCQQQRHARWQQRWQYWGRQLKLSEAELNGCGEHCLSALLWGFFDRIGQRQGELRYRLTSGGAARYYDAPQQAPEYLLALRLTFPAEHNEAVLQCVVNLDELDWQQHPALPIKQQTVARWQGQQQRLQRVKQVTLGRLQLRSEVLSGEVSAVELQQALIAYVQEHGLEVLTLSKTAHQWLARCRLLAEYGDDVFAQFQQSRLLAELADWALPFWQDIRSLKQLQQWDPLPALQARLDYQQQQQLQQACPSHWLAPSGRSVAIDYQAVTPIAAVKLQEVFGEPQSPTLVYGKVTLTLDLLSPAARLLQRTSDLASFWQTAYPQVRKEMRGRYPKHPWPEHPQQSLATTKTTRQLRKDSH